MSIYVSVCQKVIQLLKCFIYQVMQNHPGVVLNNLLTLLTCKHAPSQLQRHTHSVKYFK